MVFNNLTNNNNNTIKMISSNNINNKSNAASVSMMKANATATNSSISNTTTATSKSPTNKILSNDDKKINLNALKNQDPFATNIIDTASRVAVYKFVSKKNEWKKLDVEGSLFLFERMVEPLHSFVVMNTLALHLFLQPITADLEFQDRNPFLLYKSSNDIFGIWFIDREDCERIKTVIMKLTENARERRSKREKSKATNEKTTTPSLLSTLNQQPLNDLSTNLLYKQLFPNGVASANNNSKNLSDISSLANLLAPPPPQTTDDSASEEKPIDILQMLNKAKQQYANKSGANSETEQAPSETNNVEPKPIMSQLSKDLFLNSNEHQFVKPEPRRIGVPVTSTTTSLSPSCSSIAAPTSIQDAQPQTKLNPILQLLMSNQSNNNNAGATSSNSSEPSSNDLTITSAQDLISLDLKRKLNIINTQPINSTSQSIALNNLTESPVILSSSSMMATPSNPLILNGGGCLGLGLDGSTASNLNGGFCSSTASILKRPITLQDFEENLLNESSTSTPSNNNNANQSSQVGTGKMFFLPTEQASSENIGISCFGKRSNQMMKYKSKHNDSDAHNTSQLSTSSSSSSTSSSSSSTSSTDSDSEPVSPTTLPLLLTPAAFESSSASSTTSSSFQQNTNQFFASTTSNQQQVPQQQFAFNFLEPFNTLGSGFTNGFLFPNSNQFNFDLNDLGLTTTLAGLNNIANPSTTGGVLASSSSSAILNTNGNSTNNNNVNNSPTEISLMTKAQLQKVLIHLLNTDDNFLNTLHNAYLKSNLKNKSSGATKTKSSNGVKQSSSKSASSHAPKTALVKVFKQKKPLNLATKNKQQQQQSSQQSSEHLSYAAIVSSSSNSNLPSNNIASSK